MAIDLAIGKHAMSGVSKLLATSGGAHIYNVVLSSDADNGNLIARGAATTFDQYAEATATSFKGIVQWKAANGNFYVEVTEATDALLVYNVPMSPYDEPKLKSEKIFYNAKGEVVRAHELKVGDIFELSVEGFNGTPTVGASVTGVSNKKLTVEDSTETTGTN